MEKIVKNSKKAKDSNSEQQNLVRFYPNITEGLSAEQVNDRKLKKLTNDSKVKGTKSYLSIFVKNICTFFNFLWAVIAVALFLAGAIRDLIFIVVIVLNTALAIIQEIRAKVTVEKLSIVTAPKVKVVREGREQLIPSAQIVLDDILVLANGDQIPADCVILDGTVEVNESLLTGESVPIEKTANSPLLSGSFLVSGKCYARVDRIGKDNYVWQMAKRAKEFKAPASNLFKDLNSLIKYIGIILVPIGLLTLLKESMTGPFNEAVIFTCGSVNAMIPSGMYLLITVSLAVGVRKLSKKKTLVRDLYSIEMLARTNVLCLDKTGTITDGTMKVAEFVTYGKKRKSSIKKVLSGILYNQKTSNATSIAMVKEFGVNEKMKAAHVLEFSSQRKYSITAFGKKVYFLGAGTMIKCDITKPQKDFIEAQQKKGNRVMVLAESDKKFDKTMTGEGAQIIAIIALEEHIRDNAIETIKWFKDNGVAIKIISGDDPETVSKIAQKVGVEHYDKFVSLENCSISEVEQMATEFTVFGRVTPEQKYTLIKTLKNQGNVVAMTGDGVNDTLALKEADCSIAMADGSEVARSISKLVLLNSDFTALPAVVKEGRQVINNVQNASGIFIMKTLFAILLTTVLLVLGIHYPFQPVNMFLLELFVIGLPSFFLTFEPNENQIKGDFIPQVLKRSVPRALLLFINIFVVILIYNNGLGPLTFTEYKTLLVLTLTFTGVVNLITLYLPLTWYRAGIIAGSIALSVAAILIMGDFFKVSDCSPLVMMIFSIIILVSILVSLLLWSNRKQLSQLKQNLKNLIK